MNEENAVIENEMIAERGEAELDVQNAETEAQNSVDEAEELRERVKELQRVIDERERCERDAERKREIRGRFMMAAGNAEFINDFTRDGLLGEFERAVSEAANDGMSDSEIFGGLVDGRENLFVPPSGIPSVVAATGGGSRISDDDVRAIMGL